MERKRMGRISGIIGFVGLLVLLSSALFGNVANAIFGDQGKFIVALIGLVFLAIALLANNFLRI